MSRSDGSVELGGRRRERGQILLVGAVALAGAILAFGFVLGAGLEGGSTTDSDVRPATEVAATNHELADAIERIVHDAWNDDERAFDSGLEADIDAFLERYHRTTTSGEPTVGSADVEVTDSSTAAGSERVTVRLRYVTDGLTIERTHRITPVEDELPGEGGK